MDLLGFATNYTAVEFMILREFLNATNSSISDLSIELDSEQRFTLFAPVDAAFEDALSTGERERLLLPLWSRHLKDMLLHLLAPLPFGRDDLFEIANSGDQVETIGGSSYSLSVSDGTLVVQSGSIVGPSPAGTDG
jgi:uncharacterized surface protein with fasciclin (FAS1) repeats